MFKTTSKNATADQDLTQKFSTTNMLPKAENMRDLHDGVAGYVR